MRCLQHLERSGGADGVGEQRFLETALHGRQGRQVKDPLDARHRVAHVVRFRDTPFEELDTLPDRSQVLPVAGAAVVEDAHRMALAEQSFHKMRAYETAAARDQTFCHEMPSPLRKGSTVRIISLR